MQVTNVSAIRRTVISSPENREVDGSTPPRTITYSCATTGNRAENLNASSPFTVHTCYDPLLCVVGVEVRCTVGVCRSATTRKEFHVIVWVVGWSDQGEVDTLRCGNGGFLYLPGAVNS
jgi:hypothetical protein